jgi:hypothetical protein
METNSNTNTVPAPYFFTRDDVAGIVPSAVSSTHDGLRSDRYRFVPTVDIIESMEANGWGVVAARAPKARKMRSKEFGIHQLEFQDRNTQTAIQDPRQAGHPIFPRIHIINSHNGTSRFEVLAGLYAMVCANGLMVSAGSVGEFSVRHNASFSAEEAHRIIGEFRQRMGTMAEAVEGWSRIRLEPEQRTQFATAAARIRWNNPEEPMPEPSSLLQAARIADMGADLWTTFNVVQENLIGGGFKRSRRVARKVTQLRESNRINSELWDLASQTALALG